MKKVTYIKKREDSAFGSVAHEIAWANLEVGDVCEVKKVETYGIEQNIIFNKDDVPLCTLDSPVAIEHFNI